jgi:acetylornithine deacetylase/succinyl-diaminopimelate desuccinylase-like protein
MKNVLEYLKQNEPRFVRELCDYLKFPSVSAQPSHRKDLKACVSWLERHCREIGLDTRLCPTSGNPILVAQTPKSRVRSRPRSPSVAASRGRSKPHYLVYGHYDVQPPEPFELWHTPPFEPSIRGTSLFARGASDNKGQHFAHLKAVEAYIKTGTELPCDLTFVIEGEEEVGSDSLAGFLKEHRATLKCEGVVVSDNGMPGPGRPSLTYALRGILAVEVVLEGPSRDLHSGISGGSLDNPAMVLCQLLGRLRDPRGKITIPGFYDDVARLSSSERKQLARGEERDASYRKFLGVPKLFGERGFTPQEQRTARPTLEINGLTSGYQGDGSKTIVPAQASAKLTFRLVPNQEPDRIRRRILDHLKAICPPTVRMRVATGHAGEPYLVSPTGPQAAAALRALKAAFGATPCLKREGGSIPIVNEFRKVLKADTLLLGLALPDDNAHSPNEKFDLNCFAQGMRMSAQLWEELAAAHR